MDDLDAELVRERGPSLSRRGIACIDTGIGGDVEQRLLHEVRHEAGIRAVRQHRGWRTGKLDPEGKGFLAHGIVRPLRRRHRRVRVPAEPRFDAGIEIQRALLRAQLHQRDARDVHRQIQQEVAATDQRIEDALVVVARDRLLDEAHAELGSLSAAGVLGRHDRDAFGRNADVPQDQRQDSLADAAEPDDQEPAWEIHMDTMLGHY